VRAFFFNRLLDKDRDNSEASVRAAAGWSSGAMVARYTRALSGELAVEEFQKSWTDA